MLHIVSGGEYMKNYKIELHEYKRRYLETKKKIRRKLKVFKMKMKVKLTTIITRIERKFGLSQRCALCDEKIFCEYYACRNDGIFFHVERCHSRSSDK